MRDSKYIPEKITSKDAKEMFENAQRLEKDYKYIFNGKGTCVIVAILINMVEGWGTPGPMV